MFFLDCHDSQILFSATEEILQIQNQTVIVIELKEHFNGNKITITLI